jgi:hypothetical protein
VALARLTQMGWRPPLAERPADGADASGETEGAEPAGQVSGSANGVAVAGAEIGSVGDGVADTVLVTDTSAPEVLAENGSGASGPAANDLPELGGADRRTRDASENHVGHNGVAQTAGNGVAAASAPDAEGKDEPRRRSGTSAVAGLSFAELLAGALAAYRDS